MKNIKKYLIPHLSLKARHAGLRLWMALIMVFMPVFTGSGVYYAQAQSTPSLVNFQGRLTDASNNPLSGSHTFVFRIFDAITGGTQLWTETQATVNVTNGVLSVQLGAVTALNASVFAASSTYLEIIVDGDVLSPRQQLISVPYAHFAESLSAQGSANFVSTHTAQTISGAKIFSGAVTVPTPTLAGHAATKAYVDSAVGSDVTALSASTVSLQGQIDTNDAELVLVGASTATLHTSTVSLQGQIDANDTELVLVGASTATLHTSTMSLRTDVDAKLALAGGTLTGALDVASSAQFGAGVLKSTFSATPSDSVYALSLSSGIALADGCIQFADSSVQCVAGGAGGNFVDEAGDTMTGDLQVGEVTASTFSAGGYMTLANVSAAPSASKGRLYFDSNGDGAFKVSLDGSSFVSLATGVAGAGLSAVTSNGSQFSGDGSSGDALTLLSSSVTLQGNDFNAANRLVQLDGSGRYPALDGSQITSVTSGQDAGQNATLSTLGASTDSLRTDTDANTAQFVTVAADTTTIQGDVAVNDTQLLAVAVDTTTIQTNVSANDTQLLAVAVDTTTIQTNVSANDTQLLAVAVDTTTIQTNVAANDAQLLAVAVDTTTLDSNKVGKAGDTMTGDLQVGEVTASTFSAGGYMTLANVSAAPSASKGRLYFDSNGDGAFKVSLDGSSFVSLATGVAGAGLSAVTSNGSQFSGDGSSGDALTLLSSSVTLQGNDFNAANKLVQLDGSGRYPALDGSQITSVTSGQDAGQNATLSTLGASTDSLRTDTDANTAQFVTVAADTTTIQTNVAANDAQLLAVAVDTTTLDSNKVGKAGDTMTGILTMTNSTGGADFVVNTSTFVVEDGRVGVGTASPATHFDVAGDAQFGAGVLKSTFSAVPDGATYALSLSSGIKLANGGGIEFEDGTMQYTASVGGGGSNALISYRLLGLSIAKNNVDGGVVVPYNGSIVSVSLYREMAGTASSTIADIHKNGTTIFTTQANRPSIAFNAAGKKVTVTSMDVTSVLAGDVLTCDIDQVDAGNPEDVIVIVEIQKN